MSRIKWEVHTHQELGSVGDVVIFRLIPAESGHLPFSAANRLVFYPTQTMIYDDSPTELRKEAETMLDQFVRSIGAIWPDANA